MFRTNSSSRPSTTPSLSRSASLPLGAPCISRSTAQPRHKTQHFDVCRGMRIEKLNKDVAARPFKSFIFSSDPKPVSPARPQTTLNRSLSSFAGTQNRYSLVRQKKDRESREPALPWAPGSALPAFLAHDLFGNLGPVLGFKVFFMEGVQESASETERVRRCELYFYLNDGTIQVSEPRQENSGLPQGPFLRRHVVYKEGPSAQPGEVYGLEDLTIGSELLMYGRLFRVVDMDEKARSFMEHIGLPQGAAEAYPNDRYGSDLAERRRRETGADANVSRGKPLTALKTFAEAKLGRAVAVTQNLGRFLDNDRKVLRFYCEWNNSNALYGGSNNYILHFFLTDGTAEVREMHTHNNGRDPFPLLLSRSKLPKDYHKLVPHRDNLTDPAPSDTYYSPADLRVGESFRLWGRDMLLVDADDFTRRYYEETMGYTQGTVERAVEEREPVVIPLPPHGGVKIGSEADSLASCLHLRPKKPRVDYHKMMTNGKKVLRYSARMLTERPEDESRRFVLSFYLADDAMSVFETKRGNSGIVGGKFLERSRVKNQRSGQFYSAADFYIGARLEVMSHVFEVLDMDRYTLNYTMERPREFPWADAKAITAKLRATLAREPECARLSQQLRDRAERARTSGGGKVGVSAMRKVLSATLSRSILPEQQTVTLCRAHDNKGNVDHTALLSAILPTEDEIQAANNNGQNSARSSSSRRGSAVAGLNDTLDSTMFASTRRSSRRPSSTGRGGGSSSAMRTALRALSTAYADNRHQLRQVFRKHDGSRSGTLSPREFSAALAEACSAASVALSSQEEAALSDYFFPTGVRSMQVRGFLSLMDRV